MFIKENDMTLPNQTTPLSLRLTDYQRAEPRASLRVNGSLALAPTQEDFPFSTLEALEFARHTLRRESEAILGQTERLDERFCRAVDLILGCDALVVTGMGKAGLIGRKLSATFSSTGTPSHFLHPGEAFHGDLGSIRSHDAVLALSYSGQTEEIKRLFVPLQTRRIPVIAIVSSADTPLGRAANVTLELGAIEEADHLHLAPSATAAAMLAVGDALALTTSQIRGFRTEDFARFHPGGALGRRLSHARDCMRDLSQCRVWRDDATVREVFVAARMPGRRSGAVLLVDAQGRLSGIFTDSDLAKLFETRSDYVFDQPINSVMTRRPHAIASDAYMNEAIALMSAHKISELPVVDEQGIPVGMLDVTDLVDFLPQQTR